MRPEQSDGAATKGAQSRCDAQSKDQRTYAHPHAKGDVERQVNRYQSNARPSTVRDLCSLIGIGDGRRN